jgi:glutathione S-transferase
MTEFPVLQQWQERMTSRPAVQKGFNTPMRFDLDKIEKEDPEQFKRIMEANKKWIRHGQEANEKS